MLDELKYIISGSDAKFGKIRIHNPSLSEIRDYGEHRYIAEMSAIILRPYDAAVMLDEVGMNYQEVKDYDLFLMTIRSTIPEPTLLMPDVIFKDFEHGVNPENGTPILYNPKTGAIIDELIYHQMVEYVRGIHFIRATLEYDAGNATTRQYLIRKMKREAQRRKRKGVESQYSTIISALVNNTNCKYNYDSIWQLKVSQFWDSFFRINKLQSYQNTMIGVYTGNIDVSKLDKEGLSWCSRIDVNAAERVDRSKAVATTS